MRRYLKISLCDFRIIDIEFVHYLFWEYTDEWLLKKQIYVTLGNNMWIEAEKTKLRSKLRSKTLNEVSSNSRHERRKLSLATQ